MLGFEELGDELYADDTQEDDKVKKKRDEDSSAK